MVPGDRVKITVAPKGFGSENMTKMKMFTPAATQEQIIDFIADACIGATSIDGKPLAESDRIVLVYSTEMVNSGMILSGSRASLIKFGIAPALMRTGTLELSLRNAGSGMVLYALAVDGTRVDRLPLAPAVAGRLSIRIDTSKLAKGPTPFFELARE